MQTVQTVYEEGDRSNSDIEFLQSSKSKQREHISFNLQQAITTDKMSDGKCLKDGDDF